MRDIWVKGVKCRRTTPTLLHPRTSSCLQLLFFLFSIRNTINLPVTKPAIMINQISRFVTLKKTNKKEGKNE